MYAIATALAIVCVGVTLAVARPIGTSLLQKATYVRQPNRIADGTQFDAPPSTKPEHQPRMFR
jgi:hypothetical protein